MPYVQIRLGTFRLRICVYYMYVYVYCIRDKYIRIHMCMHININIRIIVENCHAAFFAAKRSMHFYVCIRVKKRCISNTYVVSVILSV